jgi:hypothetical protein
MPRVAAPPAQNGQAVPVVHIKPPRMAILPLRLVGTAPYLQCRFPEKARNSIMEKQAAGTQAGTKRKREARDFDADYQQAMHFLGDESHGMPAGAFRAAAISACRIVGFKMTLAKLSIFIEPDGFDPRDGTPLVRIQGEPKKHVMPGRNENGGVDIRVRAIWHEWSAILRVRFDLDQFSTEDIVNLFNRVGQQVGVGEGRPDSRNSAGMGMGLFNVEAVDDKARNR